MVTKILSITSIQGRIEYILLSIITTTATPTLNCNIIWLSLRARSIGKLTTNQEILLKNFITLCLRKNLKICYPQLYQVSSSSSSLSEPKSPGWLRAAQIGLGIIAVIISISVLASPALTVVSLVILV